MYLFLMEIYEYQENKKVNGLKRRSVPSIHMHPIHIPFCPAAALFLLFLFYVSVFSIQCFIRKILLNF